MEYNMLFGSVFEGLCSQWFTQVPTYFKEKSQGKLSYHCFQQHVPLACQHM